MNNSLPCCRLAVSIVLCSSAVYKSSNTRKQSHSTNCSYCRALNPDRLVWNGNVDPFQHCDSSIDVHCRIARRCAVLQDLCICPVIVSSALHGDREAIGTVASGFDVNVRGCNRGQSSIFRTATQGVFDFVHQVDCDLVQGEAVVVGIGDADIHRNGDIEARA